MSNAIRDEVRWFELNVTDAGALTFEGNWTSKDDLTMALTYILWYGGRTGGIDRPVR
ncbi:MAG: hypothetical protein ACXWEM_06430 [Halobacteriota archaeon]